MPASYFEIANICGALVSFAFLLTRKFGVLKYIDVLILVYTLAVCAMSIFWVRLNISINIFLLIFVLYFFCQPKKAEKNRSVNYSPTPIGWIIMSFFFLTPFPLVKAEGWAIVLFSAAAYWFLYVYVSLYESTNNMSLRSIIGFLVFAAGLLWGFKLAILIGLTIILVQLFNSFSSGKSFALLVALAVGVSLASYFYYAQIELFMYQSLLRPDYDLDVKVLGLSDGGRLNLWMHYIENSELLGKGQYNMPDVVPTHNIFVHLIHEFGMLGFFLIAPVIFCLFFRIAKYNGFIYFFLILTTLNLSSIGEFPVFWVPCLIFARLLTSSLIIAR
jgi:hypothetical protein